MHGDPEDHAGRYERTREFLQIVRRLWTETPVSHISARYGLVDTVLEPKPEPAIPVYLGGASPAAQHIAAELAASARRVDGVGQRRQITLADRPDLVVEDHLWAGLDIRTFIRSGYPHVEECRTFGELVLPRSDRPTPLAERVLLGAGIAPIC